MRRAHRARQGAPLSRATARTGRRRCRPIATDLAHAAGEDRVARRRGRRRSTPTAAPASRRCRTRWRRHGARTRVSSCSTCCIVDGYDLRGVALTERKRAAARARRPRRRHGPLRPRGRGQGARVLRQACTLGLEGIVSKRADSTLRTACARREWVKVKCMRRQEMVIGGYTDPQGARTGIRRAAARRLRRRQAALRGQGRHRLRRRDAARRCTPQLAKLRADTPRVRESAARLRGEGRALGQARARRRDRVHRMEPTTARCAIRRSWACAQDKKATRRRARETRRAAHRHAGETRRTAGTRESARAQARRRASGAQARSAGAPQRRRERGVAGVTHVAIPTSSISRSGHHQARRRALLRERGAAAVAAYRRTAVVPGALSRRLERRSASTRSTPTRASTRRSARIEVPEGKGTATYLGASHGGGAGRARAMGRHRNASVGLAHAAARPARSADLRFRSGRRR